MAYLEKFASTGQEFEAKELFTNYSVDVVATTGFGVEGKTFSDPNSVVRYQVCIILNFNQQIV